MKTLWMKLIAPFAAYRYFQAGVYRATAPTIPHSAAWGLALNLAAIDIRTNVDSPTTEISEGAPKLEIAVGALSAGPVDRCSLYQQLHSYPVGSSGKEFAERTKGAKYWIAPARREFLVGFSAVVGIRTDESELIDRIKSGLQGELSAPRYGLPFAGDNNLLFDDISVSEEPEPAFWYLPLGPADPALRGSCRLSIGINRRDSSKTHNATFAPSEIASSMPPEQAWVLTPCAP